MIFISQREGYQSDQNSLHHYQHSKNQLNSEINFQDTADHRVS